MLGRKHPDNTELMEFGYAVFVGDGGDGMEREFGFGIFLLDQMDDVVGLCQSKRTTPGTDLDKHQIHLKTDKLINNINEITD